MRISLLRGFIAIAAAVAATRCVMPKEPPLKPRVWVESAHDCTHGPNCKPVPKPQEIKLRVGHKHDLKIIREDSTPIEIAFDPLEIVHLTESSEVTPKESRDVIEADTLGATTLNIELKDPRHPDDLPHPNDRNTLKIETFSKRVTVVGWVDGNAIDPDVIAPHASETVKEHFSTDEKCGKAVMEILLHKRLSFISSESPEQDRLYAQAFLVRSSKNEPPPEKLEELIERGDYRLLNDFQVIGAEGRRFDPKMLPGPSEVGETPLPCGVDTLRNNRWIRQWIDHYRPDHTDHHKRNGERLDTDEPERFAQLNQGRLGWLGRYCQAVLTGTDREPDDLTPWVWSLVAFDKNGRFVMKNAGFPRYSVYIDGKLKQKCGTEQAKFEDFLKRDASWQFDSANVDVATLIFNEEGDCR
ncbi:MAG: hypothetical protein ACJ74H_16580 [Thermoanaerobaculia bacterium]